MNEDAAREAAFARAYRMIKAAIEPATGTGMRLLVGDFTRATGLSPTPVREALSRLVGEGLIEEHRGGGYFVPWLDARDVADFYALARMLTLGAVAERASGLATHRTRRLLAMLGDPPEPVEAQLAYWFERLAIASGNRILALEMRRLNGRMVAIRRAELAVLSDREALIATIAALVETGDAEGQIRWIERYHREGHEKSGEIADWLSA